MTHCANLIRGGICYVYYFGCQLSPELPKQNRKITRVGYFLLLLIIFKAIGIIFVKTYHFEKLNDQFFIICLKPFFNWLVASFFCLIWATFLGSLFPC